MDADKKIWEILVPAMMYGRPIRTHYHRLWDEKIKQIAGGLTITPPTKGYWISNEGKTIKEQMIPIRIMCTSDEIETIADITARHYNQDAIMFYKISDGVYINHYTKDKK